MLTLTEKKLFSTNHEREGAYWKQKLTGEWVSARLPESRRFQSVNQFKIKDFKINPGTASRLLKISNGSAAQLHICFLTGLYILLREYSGKSDIILGSMIFAQQRTEEFINVLLPLRIKGGPNVSFKALLLAVKKELSESIEHQNYPIEILVDESNSHDTAVAFKQLFDVVVLSGTLHDKSYVNLDQFNTVVSSHSDGDEVSMQIRYNNSICSDEHMDNIAAHLDTILSNCVADHDAPLDDNALLMDASLLDISNNLNNGLARYDVNETVQAVLARQAAKTPGAAALIFEQRIFSYDELEQASRKIAGYLQSIGVTRNTVVALYFEPSIEMIIGIVAVLKAGAAYLPIDPSHPVDRIVYIIKDSNAQFFLTSKNAQLPFEFGFDVVAIEDAMNDNKPFIDCRYEPSDATYIIYTSGTTGHPKGVIIQNRNMLRLFFHDGCHFDFGENDTWMLFHSYCFDFSVWEIFGALLFGGSLVIAPKEHRKDPHEIIRLIENEGVTILNQTPSSFYNLMNAEHEQPLSNGSLRMIIFGGEALDGKRLLPWQLKYPATKLINMYGITETTVHVTYKEIGRDTKNASVGRAIPTLSAFIANNFGRLMPLEIPGEILVGGEGLARGYLNKPELTNERFVVNPSRLLKGRFYRSGDLGLVNRDLEIEYIGRMDDQIQLRGFRIELKEIESHVLQHRAVRSTVVTLVTKNGEDVLCCYYVSANGEAIDDLKHHLKKFLPDYMLPSFFMRIDALPLSVNGKIDKRSLPLPEIQSITDEVSNVLEDALSKIWREHLSLSSVSVADDYFSLGGDSIKAIRLLTMVNNHFKTELKYSDIYANSTIRSMAVVVSGQVVNVREKSVADEHEVFQRIRENVLNSHPDPNDIEDCYPISDIELGMIYHSQLNPSTYVDQFIHFVEIENFSEDVFSKALQLVAKKHGILRSSYELDRFETPVHVIYKYAEIEHTHYDLQKYPDVQKGEFAKSALTSRRSKPFDITKPGLINYCTFQFKPNLLLVGVTFHHAILDGWSDALLNVELLDTYFKLLDDHNYSPGKLKATHRDFVRDEYREKQSGQYLEFWRNEFDEDFLSDLKHRAISDSMSLKKDLCTRVLPETFFESLTDRSKIAGISPRSICFCAYSLAMAGLTGDEKLLLGLTAVNRSVQEDGERVLGCFINLLPLKINVNAALTYGQYLKYVDDRVKDALKNSKVPMFEIFRLLNKQAGNKILLDNLFAYLDFHVYRTKEADQLMEVARDYNFEMKEQVNTSIPFDLIIDVTRGVFKYSIGYDESRITRSLASTFARLFETALEGLINTPDKYLSLDQGVSSGKGRSIPGRKLITSGLEFNV